MNSQDETERAAGDLTQVSLLGLAIFVVRHRTLILAFSGVGALIAVLVAFFSFDAPYVSESTFKVEAAGTGETSIAALASRLGVGESAPGGESLAFYSYLLQSRQILSRVAGAPISHTSRSDAPAETHALMDALPIAGADHNQRLNAAVEVLRSRIQVSTNPSAGLIHLAVRAESPALALTTSEHILDQIVQFNLEKRQSQSRVERHFVEGQVTLARQNLRDAERMLETFMQENRSWENSPQLMFEHGRLRRDIDLRNSLYTSLALAYEQARIDEVRTTPTITIIEPPIPGSWSARSVRARAAILGVALGMLIALAVALTRELLRRQLARHPAEAAELHALSRQSRLMAFGMSLFSVVRRKPTAARQPSVPEPEL